MESHPVAPPTKVESSARNPIPAEFDVVSPVQQKARVPVLEKNMMNQLSEDEQKALNSKFQEATDADNKVCGYLLDCWIYEGSISSLFLASCCIIFHILKVEFTH